jgi:hypothetical protein
VRMDCVCGGGGGFGVVYNVNVGAFLCVRWWVERARSTALLVPSPFHPFLFLPLLRAPARSG